MIKAEDLRIGDLVKVRGNYFFEEGEICKVEAVDTCSYGKKIEGGYIMLKGLNWSELSVGHYKDYREIDPITLTPEILEKNGWKRDKLVPYIYGHEAHYIEVICTPNSEWVDVTFKGDTLHRIKYAHELQHILWALGKDANLKI